MDPSTQKYVLDLIYGKCTVIHPPRETLITLLAADITESSGGAPAKQLFQNADTEAVLGDGADLQEATRTEFWDFQKTLSSVTADHPSYERACELLSLDPARPRVENVTLFPWQVVAVSWFRLMEESTIPLTTRYRIGTVSIDKIRVLTPAIHQ